jgi:hypothetical protein
VGDLADRLAGLLGGGGHLLGGGRQRRGGGRDLPDHPGERRAGLVVVADGGDGLVADLVEGPRQLADLVTLCAVDARGDRDHLDRQVPAGQRLERRVEVGDAVVAQARHPLEDHGDAAAQVADDREGEGGAEERTREGHADDGGAGAVRGGRGGDGLLHGLVLERGLEVGDGGQGRPDRVDELVRVDAAGADALLDPVDGLLPGELQGLAVGGGERRAGAGERGVGRLGPRGGQERLELPEVRDVLTAHLLDAGHHAILRLEVAVVDVEVRRGAVGRVRDAARDVAGDDERGGVAVGHGGGALVERRELEDGHRRHRREGEQQRPEGDAEAGSEAEGGEAGHGGGLLWRGHADGWYGAHVGRRAAQLEAPGRSADNRCRAVAWRRGCGRRRTARRAAPGGPRSSWGRRQRTRNVKYFEEVFFQGAWPW